MAWNFAARPAGHRVASTGKWRHIFEQGEDLTIALTSGDADQYEVRDYYGDVVASGPVSGTSLTLPALPLGWYKLYLIRPSSIGDPWRLAGGELTFVVCRPNAALPRPAVGTSPGQDPVGEGVDLPTRGYTRMGPHRHSVRLGANFATDKTKALTDAADLATRWGTPDAARPLKRFANFPDGTGGTAPTGTDTSQITEAVTDMVAAGVTWFEGRNEPQGTAAATYATELAAFSTTVRAAGGLVAGPCPVDIKSTWLDQVLAAAGSSIDVISVHNYNGCQGDLAWGRRVLDNFVATLTRYGQQNKPRLNSEAFSYFAAVYGSYEPRLQTENTMLELHLLEQYGMPKEQTSIFYDRSHGFWDYPSWWINAEIDLMLNPLAGVARVWSEELMGKSFAERLDFGDEDNHWLGSRFDGADGTKTVAVQSAGRRGAVTFTASGASSLTLVSPWGVESTLAVTGGEVTVDVDSLPVYLRLPVGVTCVPKPVTYGINVLDFPRRRIAFTASSQATSPILAGSGSLPVSGSFGSTEDTFRSATSVGDEWWSMTLPSTVRFDRAVVWTLPPWQSDSGLTDFDVQAWVDGAWVTVATETEPTPVVPWVSHKDAGACYTDSYYSRRRVFVITLDEAVETTQVRIYARGFTYGGAATAAVVDGDGLVAEFHGQTGPRRLCLREVQLFLSGKTDGGTATPGQPLLPLTGG